MIEAIRCLGFIELFRVKPEIERRFLVATMPNNYAACSHEEMKTGYLSIAKGFEDRIRQEGNVFTRITKTGEGIGKKESRKPVRLTEKQFNELVQGACAVKSETRYYIPVEGHVKGRKAHLKIMHGRDEGKGEVEVEFRTKRAAKNFLAPSWFGREITSDDRYASKELGPNGYPEEARLPR
jgi:adenylate cyclase